MGQIKGTKYGYDDINIVPEKMTTLRSRSEVNLYDRNGFLPIIAAPMDSVVGEEQYRTFEDNLIYSVIPRTVPFKNRCTKLLELNGHHGVFIAFSLVEARKLFLELPPKAYNELERCRRKLITTALNSTDACLKICIDIANGHMSDVIDTIREIKGNYGYRVSIMAGNIANPETYRLYEDAGCDYVRVSIGSGEGCLTSTNTGIHYPIFSLLEETYRVKQDIGGHCEIIADGGIRCFGDIQKALIYADYVMIGGLFSRMVESAGDIFMGRSYWKIRGRRIFRPIKTLLTYGRKATVVDVGKMKEGTQEYFRIFRGMSTPEAQKDMALGGSGVRTVFLKPTEGLSKKVKVDMVLEEWARQEKGYAASMMSYVNARNYDECKDSSWIVKQSKNHN